MERFLYALAIALIILWAIGYLGYDLDGMIHILLVIAIIAVLVRIIKGKKPI